MHMQFNQNARDLGLAVRTQQRLLHIGIESLGNRIELDALHMKQNTSWPFYLTPNFDSHAQDAIKTGMEVVMIASFVSREEVRPFNP